MNTQRDTSDWCDTLLTTMMNAEPSFDFVTETTSKRTGKGSSGVRYYDLHRSRKDGLFDRVFIEFEHLPPYNQDRIAADEVPLYGWIVRFQYAINKNPSCPIPCIVDGFYCNLFDLTEYAPEYEDLISTIGSYCLGDDKSQFEAKLVDLGAFFGRALPKFCQRAIAEKINPQQGMAGQPALSP